MTREEAVKMLQATRLMLMDGANQPISDLYYALDMAIEVLEQTEPNSSVFPNNCEPKICDTCRYYNSSIPCGSTPSACKEADKFAEEFVGGLKKLKPKTEPQTYVINPQEPTNDDKCFECDDFFTCGGQCNKIEDEPRTEDLQDWKDRMWAEAVIEPRTERIKTLDYCDICNHKGCDNCIANSLDDYCVPSGYEPITQTETQNSNLTFEKRTMLDCYNCKRFETEGECIECEYEPKDEPQTEMPRCSVNGTPYDECGFCEYFNCETCKCEADVTQMERRSK